MLLLFIHLHHLFEHESFKFEWEKGATKGEGEQVEKHKQRHIVFDMLSNILSNNNTTSMDHSSDRYAFSPSQPSSAHHSPVTMLT